MKIMINVGHPAQIHFFRKLAQKLVDNGHSVKFIARDKDVAIKILENTGFDYDVISHRGNNLYSLILEMIKRHYLFIGIIKKYSPDLILSGFDPSATQIGKLFGIPTIILADNRPNVKRLSIGLLVLPFAETVLSLTTVKYDFGAKGIKMAGYKELAYLHPNQFKPDSKVLKDAGLLEDENFVLLRFVTFDAYHDFSAGGLDIEAKKILIKRLEKYAKVFVSSESPLPAELIKYKLPIPPEKIHDLLFYAKLLVCDSQTMTTEAAVLGTPAIRCNSFVGKNDMGNFIELENKYGLIFNYSDANEALNKAIELIQIENIKEEWSYKRKEMLSDKIDITSFLSWFIETYPDS